MCEGDATSGHVCGVARCPRTPDVVGECVGPSDTHDHAACGAKRADGSPIRLWGISRRVAQLGPHSKNRGSRAQMSVPLGRNGTEPVRAGQCSCYTRCDRSGEGRDSREPCMSRGRGSHGHAAQLRGMPGDLGRRLGCANLASAGREGVRNACSRKPGKVRERTASPLQ